MLKVLARGVLALLGVSMALVPGESGACCFTNCFKRQATYAAPCEVCPQQVNYVPQTCYRTVYRCEPCTSYKPVTTCDPCTGCPQTVMQPVTTYVRRPVQVPYTTYRPVVSAVAYAPSPCATCNTGAAYYSPTYAAAPGCSTCGPTTAAYTAPAATYAAPAAVPAYGAPAMTAPSMAPAYSTQPYTSQPYSAPNYTTQPSLGMPTPAMPGGSVPQTFQPSQQQYNSQPSQQQDSSSLRPIEPPADPQDDNEPKMNSSSTPRLLDPQNRTTARPMMGPARVMPAIFQFKAAKRPVAILPASIPGKTAIDDGWRPGSR